MPENREKNGSAQALMALASHKMLKNRSKNGSVLALMALASHKMLKIKVKMAPRKR